MKLVNKLSIAIFATGLITLAAADRARSLSMEVTSVGDQKIYYLSESGKNAPVFRSEDDFIPSQDVKFYGSQVGMTTNGDIYVLDQNKNARWVFDTSSMGGFAGNGKQMESILSSAFGGGVTQSPSGGLGSVFGGGANGTGGMTQSTSDFFASIFGGAGNSNGGLSPSDREFFASVFSGGLGNINAGNYELPEGVTPEQVQSFFSSIFGGAPTASNPTANAGANQIPTTSSNATSEEETAKSFATMLASNGVVNGTTNKFIEEVMPGGVTEEEVGQFFAKNMANGVITNDTAKKFMETVLPGGVTEKEAQEFFAKEYAAGAFGSGEAGNFIKSALSDGVVSKEEEEEFFKSFSGGKSFAGMESGDISAILKSLGNGDGKFKLPNGLTVEELAKFFSSMEGKGTTPSTTPTGSIPLGGNSGGDTSSSPKKVPEPSSILGLALLGIGAAVRTLKKNKFAKRLTLTWR